VTYRPGQALHTLENVVILRDVPVPLDTEIGEAFISDCARNTEGLVGDKELKAKWGLTNEAWFGLSENNPLLNAIRTERDRRIVTGIAASEAAHQQYAKAPNVLGSILSNDDISPRHRIEAARELRAAATAGQRDKLAQPEKITIIINLGADEKLVYEKEGPPPPDIRDGALD
jgi:hypothetical protein